MPTLQSLIAAAILDSLPTMAFALDPDERTTHANHPWLSFVGATLEEEVAGPWRNTLHDDDGGPWARAWDHARGRQQAFSLDCRRRVHDGTFRAVSLDVRPYFDAKHRLAGYVATVTEAMPRGTLPSSIAARFLDAGSMPVAWLDAHGYPVRLNRAWEEELGPSDDPRGLHARISAFHPADLPVLAAQDERFAGRATFSYEARTRASDGSYRWRRFSADPVFADTTLEGWLVVASDIDEQRRRERDEALLAEVGRTLALTLDFEETVEAMARSMLRELGDYCLIDLLDTAGGARRDEMSRAAAVHRDPRLQPLLSSLVRMRLVSTEVLTEVLDGSGPVLLNVAAGSEEPPGPGLADVPPALWPHELMVVPLRAHGRSLGTLTVVTSDPREQRSERDLALASRIADLAALAMANADAHREAAAAAEGMSRAYAELNALFSYSPLGKALLDREARFVRVNERLAAFNGLPVEAHLGRSVPELLPDVWPSIEPYFRQALDGRAAEFEIAATTHAYHEPRVWAEIFYPIADAEGRVIGVGVSVSDVTGRKAVEESLARATAELAAHHRRLTTIIDATGVGVAQFDAAGVIEFINTTGAAMLAYEPEELVGLHGHDTLHGRRPDGTEIPRTACEVFGAFADGEPWRGELHYIAKDGAFVPLEMTGVPLLDASGQPTGSVISFQDATERIEATQRREQLAAAAAHELLNPLTAVIGFTRIIQRQASAADSGWAADQQESLTMLLREAERLARTTEAFLDMSRIETGVLRPSISEAELPILVRQEVVALRRRAPAATVVERYGAGVPPVPTDELRVRQIVANLLDNALQHGNDSEIEVSVEVVEVGGGAPSMVAIRIQDHGPGVPEAARAQLFERYHRGLDPERRALKGLGLNLYISNQVAALLGGTLTLEAPPDGGSAFVLRLPMPRSTVPAPATRPSG